MLENVADNRTTMGGTALLGFQQQIDILQGKLNNLNALKDRLLSNVPSTGGSFPFSNVGTGPTAAGTGFSAPYPSNRAIVPYRWDTPNPQADLAQKQILTASIAAREEANARMASLSAPVVNSVNQESAAVDRLAAHWTDAQGRAVASQMTMEQAATQATQGIDHAAAVQNAPVQPLLADDLAGFGSAKRKTLQANVDKAINDSWQAGILQYAHAQGAESDKFGNPIITGDEQAKFNDWYTNQRYDRSRAFAEKNGFAGVPNFTKVGSSGVEQLDWRQENAMGTTEKLRTFNTPAGGNLESTSRQFQTLTSAIGRDLRELTKWSIAIALIYGPLNALKTLYADMVESQTRLANAMIATTAAGLSMSEIFNAANYAANAMGTGVSDTINSFTEAYRATGNLGTVQERVTTTSILLKDALTLSKLSGMEEATAIDTLAASLRQTNTPLDQGATLLDKWVKTTQNANVDLQALATGFAVMGDAAETAGMTVDQLNGLLAAIAETGIGSGKEVANAAKAIVAGFYSDRAVKQLNNLGIATKDAEGNLRDFNSIATEVYQQRQLGLISDTAFQTTMRDIGGGGNRRQAAVTTLIENYARVQQVAAYSAQASGEASSAMGRRLDTVQTSTTRLNNSFQSLAMSLGNEGGILDLFGKILDVVTGLTTGFSTLMSTIGKAGPVLMTTLAGGLLLKSQGPLAANVLGGKLDNLLIPLLGNSYINTSQSGKDQYGASINQTFAGSRIVSKLLSSSPNMWNIGAGALIGGIMPALGNLANRNEDPFASTKAAFNIGGSIGGMVISTMLGQSPIIGATIGSAIGEALISTATHKGSIATVLAETGASGYKTPPKVQYSPDVGTDALYAAQGFGQAWLGKLITGIPGIINQTIYGKGQDTFIYQVVADEAAKGNKTAVKALAEFNKAVEADKLANPGNYNLPTTEIERKQQDQMKLHGPVLTQMRKGAEAELLTKVQTGDITSADYTRKMDALSTYEERATKWQATFGNLLIGNVKGINSEMDAYQAFLNLITDGSTEALDSITAISSEIFDSQNQLAGLKASTALGTDLMDLNGQTQTKDYFINQLTDRVTYLEGILPTIVQTGNQAAQASHVNVPSVVNLQAEAYSQADYDLIRAKARADQFKELRQLNPSTGPNAVSDADINAYLDAQDKFGVYVGVFGEAVALLTGGISQDEFKKASDVLFGEGKVKTGPSSATNKKNPQMLDIYSSQFPQLQALTAQAGEALKTIPGYTLSEEDLQVFGKDWVGGIIHGDSIAMRLALEKLIGIQEKQLDGIYNLPDGSFFTAFLTPEWMTLMQQGGGETTGGFPTGSTTTTTPGQKVTNATYADWGKYQADQMMGAPVKNATYAQFGAYQQLRQPVQNRTYADWAAFQQPYDERKAAIDEFQKNKVLPAPAWEQRYKNLSGLGNNVQPIPKINMNINTTTTVQLDGRVIASIIKVYLAADLARMTSGYGKAARDYIG
jgi:TP901 family phage tail tape measure protein